MTAELDLRDELMNPFGVAHGGVISAMVDHVLGAALYPVIPRGAWAATTEFKVNLLAAVREGMVRAHSEVIALTKRTAVVRIDVCCGAVLVAAAQGTVTIRLPAAAGPSRTEESHHHAGHPCPTSSSPARLLR